MNRIPKLSERLQKIADLVPLGCKVADIGTDHAYIPVYLVNSGVIEFAIASDVVAGPIERAKNTIREYGAEGAIDLRLGSGLKTIKPNEVDTVIIAGMGGILISEIMAKSGELLKSVETIILQPMTAAPELRKYLAENEFRITKEVLAKEDKKIYNILVAKNGHEEIEDELYYYIGKRLIEGNDIYYNNFLDRQILRLEKMVCGIENSKNEELRQRLYEKKKLLNKIKELKG